VRRTINYHGASAREHLGRQHDEAMVDSYGNPTVVVGDHEQETDKLASARSQAKAQFESIKEMVEALHVAHNSDNETRGASEAIEDVERTIHEDALSVEVRSDWYCPGGDGDSGKPFEYCILLCTGGPAVRIVGRLNEHCEPESAQIECQDWFTPWTPVYLDEGERLGYSEEIMLAYARCFYYGE